MQTAGNTGAVVRGEGTPQSLGQGPGSPPTAGLQGLGCFRPRDWTLTLKVRLLPLRCPWPNMGPGREAEGAPEHRVQPEHHK